MSDSTTTAPLPTMLRSPFNGAAWPVPPDAAPVMVEALIKAGFVPIEPKKRKDEKPK